MVQHFLVDDDVFCVRAVKQPSWNDVFLLLLLLVDVVMLVESCRNFCLYVGDLLLMRTDLLLELVHYSRVVVRLVSRPLTLRNPHQRNFPTDGSSWRSLDCRDFRQA